MHIHSRQTYRPVLNEGLGFDTRRSLAGMSTVRSSMDGLLSQEGDNRARGRANTGPVSLSNTAANYSVVLVMANTSGGLSTPQLTDIVLPPQTTPRNLTTGNTTPAVMMVMLNTSTLHFEMQGKKLEVKLSAMSGGVLNGINVNQNYNITVTGPQSLIPTPGFDVAKLKLLRFIELTKI